MDSKYNSSLFEKQIYEFWEKGGLFEANLSINGKKPFSIILPPPNANADLHLGHAMYVYEDIMIRYHKLIGDESLWLPGADHAGFETQFVFEKELQKKGKTRLDYDQETLFKMIWDFVMANKSEMEDQLRRLGFALDWKKKKFTLDPDIIKIVYRTFKELFDARLVYRAKKLVNYCTFCGTSFSDLEVVYKDRRDPLYYIKYQISKIKTTDQKSKNNYNNITVATTRPETMLGDTALAVNPKDKRYKNLTGKTAVITLINREIPIIADESVDLKFGTGVVKVTPAHDFTDFETGQRHSLMIKQVIGFDGKLNELTGKYCGLYVNQARKAIVEDLKKAGLMEKIKEDYQHRVGTCYKCGRPIEPLPKEQWFVKIRPLADQAKKLVNSGKIKIYPNRFKKALIDWLNNFHDWNISRQVVWGIRIPAHQCKSKVQKSIKSKVGTDWFVSVEKPEKCLICGECDFVQDDDTFDTWFSSAQWPFATLLTTNVIARDPVSTGDRSNPVKYIDEIAALPSVARNDKGDDFYNYFYPTTVMETGYDILPWWVARMIMIGYFITGKEPFKNVFFHGMVRDKQGKKMSKSKGNVINPIKMVDKYGADALRLALVFEVKEGNDVVVTEEKIIGMRNFTNKIWNIGRFLLMNSSSDEIASPDAKGRDRNDNNVSSVIPSEVPNHSVRDGARDLVNRLNKEFLAEKKQYLKYMESYRFSQALGLVYEFLWHRFADFYIKELKEEIINGNIKVLEGLKEVYFENLKMIHPFAPFVTEAVWKTFNGEKSSILLEKLLS